VVIKETFPHVASTGQVAVSTVRLHKAIKQSGTGLIVSIEQPLDVCRESEYYEFEGYFELCGL